MELKTKQKQTAITQARVIRATGEIEYHYSLPKIAIWNIKGMIWLWRRLKAFKADRIKLNENNVKIIYH